MGHAGGVPSQGLPAAVTVAREATLQRQNQWAVAVALRLVVGLADGLDHGFSFAVEDGQLACRGVVAVLHARGAGALVLPKGPHHRRIHDAVAADLRDLLPGHAAGAQDARHVAGHVHHGGLHAHVAGPAVQDQRNASVHVLEHVGGGGGAGPSGAVAAGRGDGTACRTDQRPRNRMGRHAHGHGVQPAGGAQGHAVGLREDQRQRPRPVRGHQRAGGGGGLHGDERPQLLHVVDVHDQRIVAGAALRLEDGGHGLRVQRVRAQPVHRLGGDAHQPALADQLCGLTNGSIVRLQYAGVQGNRLLQISFRSPAGRSARRGSARR